MNQEKNKTFPLKSNALISNEEICANGIKGRATWFCAKKLKLDTNFFSRDISFFAFACHVKSIAIPILFFFSFSFSSVLLDRLLKDFL